MQSGSSLRPRGRAIAPVVVWLVAVVIVAATSQVRAGDNRVSAEARPPAAQAVSTSVARPDPQESPALTIALVAILAGAGATVASLRGGLGPIRARRLVPVRQRIVVRRS